MTGSPLGALKPAPKGPHRLALFHGPDEGLARDLAERAFAMAAGAERYDRVDLSDEALKSEPNRLSDEAQAIDLFGARRVVRLTAGRDPSFKAVRSFLDAVDTAAVDTNFIAVIAGDLPATHALRKTVAKSACAVGIACRMDGDAAVAVLIEEAEALHGVRFTEEARDVLTSVLGGDFGVTRSEIEKIALGAVDGVVGASEALELCAPAAGAPATSAAGRDAALRALAGDADALVARLQRMPAGGQEHQTCLLALQRLLLQLMAVKAARGDLDRLRPKPFGEERRILGAALGRMSPQALWRSVRDAGDAVEACRQTGAPVRLICERAMFRIATRLRKTG